MYLPTVLPDWITPPDREGRPSDMLNILSAVHGHDSSGREDLLRRQKHP